MAYVLGEIVFFPNLRTPSHALNEIRGYEHVTRSSGVLYDLRMQVTTTYRQLQQYTLVLNVTMGRDISISHTSVDHAFNPPPCKFYKTREPFQPLIWRYFLI